MLENTGLYAPLNTWLLRDDTVICDTVLGSRGLGFDSQRGHSNNHIFKGYLRTTCPARGREDTIIPKINEIASTLQPYNTVPRNYMLVKKYSKHYR